MNEIEDYVKSRAKQKALLKKQLTVWDGYTKYKVLLLGDASVGKTCIMRSLMGRDFVSKSISTVGIDFVKKGFDIDDAKVLLEVWDTAGQERFRSITKFHYRGTKGVVLVYDITNKQSFDTLNYWIESIEKDIDLNNKEPVPIFIVGNKTDLVQEREVSKEEGEQVAYRNCVHGFIETSAKDNVNVLEVFSKLAHAMTEIYDPSLLKGYEHLRQKSEEGKGGISCNKSQSEQFTISEDPLLRKKKKRRKVDFTRNTNSIMLSAEHLKKENPKCVCFKK